jgi:predicted nucleic acid-binding protein
VIVAALRSPTGASAELLRLLRAGKLRVAATVPLFMEYEAVWLREEHVLAAGLAARDVQAFLDGLSVLIEPVALYFTWRPQLRDPADEMVLEAAVNAGADTLVTFNQRDFANVGKQFKLRVTTPGDFLRNFKHE